MERGLFRHLFLMRFATTSSKRFAYHFTKNTDGLSRFKDSPRAARSMPLTGALLACFDDVI